MREKIRTTLLVLFLVFGMLVPMALVALKGLGVLDAAG